MSYKWIGAILVVVGCGGVGFTMAANHIKQERSLRQLVAVLDYMECELQYRLTALPQLCRQAAQECAGKLQVLFLSLAHELEDQIQPNVDICMRRARRKVRDLPPLTDASLELLGRSLGRFDLEGQLKGLDNVRQECRRNLGLLNDNREYRLRGYQTLGLCAGAALAILLV